MVMAQGYQRVVMVVWLRTNIYYAIQCRTKCHFLEIAEITEGGLGLDEQSPRTTCKRMA